MSRTVAARYGGVCPVCERRWAKGDPIAAFDDTGEHTDRWGHPACVAADAMGHASVEEARQHIARARRRLDDATKPPMGPAPISTRGAVK